MILPLSRTLEESALSFVVLANCDTFLNAARLLCVSNGLLVLIFYILTEAEPLGASICLGLPPSGYSLGVGIQLDSFSVRQALQRLLIVRRDLES